MLSRACGFESRPRHPSNMQAKLLNVKPFQEKLNAGYCGPAVLKMTLEYYGIEKAEEELATLAGTNEETGTDDKALQRVLESFGLKVTIKNEASFEDIQSWLDKEVPVIVDWFTRGRADYPDSAVADGHYSIVVGLDDGFIYLQDPEIGSLRKLARNDFMKVWFDFCGEQITSWGDIILRQLIAVYK